MGTRARARLNIFTAGLGWVGYIENEECSWLEWAIVDEMLAGMIDIVS